MAQKSRDKKELLLLEEVPFFDGTVVDLQLMLVG